MSNGFLLTGVALFVPSTAAQSLSRQAPNTVGDSLAILHQRLGDLADPATTRLTAALDHYLTNPGQDNQAQLLREVTSAVASLSGTLWQKITQPFRFLIITPDLSKGVLGFQETIRLGCQAVTGMRNTFEVILLFPDLTRFHATLTTSDAGEILTVQAESFAATSAGRRSPLQVATVKGFSQRIAFAVEGEEPIILQLTPQLDRNKALTGLTLSPTQPAWTTPAAPYFSAEEPSPHKPQLLSVSLESTATLKEGGGCNRSYRLLFSQGDEYFLTINEESRGRASLYSIIAVERRPFGSNESQKVSFTAKMQKSGDQQIFHIAGTNLDMSLTYSSHQILRNGSQVESMPPPLWVRLDPKFKQRTKPRDFQDMLELLLQPNQDRTNHVSWLLDFLREDNRRLGEILDTMELVHDEADEPMVGFLEALREGMATSDSGGF